MTRSILTLTLVLLAIMASAQANSVKLYAYKEPVIGGAFPQAPVEEGGNSKEVQQKSRFNYLIYLASDTRIYPSEIWIDGHPYSAGMETVTAPVTRQNFTAPGQPKMELVPATGQRLVQLKPGPAITGKLSKEGRMLAASNEIVVVYKMNGKFYHVVQPAFKLLEPVALQ